MTALVLTTKSKETKHYIHPKHKTEIEKTAIATKTIYSLISYASYDLLPKNGEGPVLTTPQLLTQETGEAVGKWER